MIWLFNFAGRLAYQLSLPVIRAVISRTRRAYILLVSEDKVLVVKGWLGRQKWQLPGGGVKKGEDDKLALIRELAEETGIDVSASKLTLVASGNWKTDRLAHRYKVYLTSLPALPKTKRLKPELIELAWLRPSKLDPSNAPAEILAALHTSGLV